MRVDARQCDWTRQKIERSLLDFSSVDILQLRVTLAELEITKVKLQDKMSHSSAKTKLCVYEGAAPEYDQ
jgi:hypothetical protein